VIPTLTILLPAGAANPYLLAAGASSGWQTVGDYDPTSLTIPDHNMADATTETPSGTFVPLVPPVPGTFDPQTFLARADVQALPLAYQSTLLYYNQTLADTLAHNVAVVNAVTTQAQSSWDAADSALSTAEALVGTIDPYGNVTMGQIDQMMLDALASIEGILNPPTMPPVDPNPILTQFLDLLQTTTTEAVAAGAAADAAAAAAGGGEGGSTGSSGGGNSAFFSGLLTDITTTLQANQALEVANSHAAMFPPSPDTIALLQTVSAAITGPVDPNVPGSGQNADTAATREQVSDARGSMPPRPVAGEGAFTPATLTPAASAA
jgi:hypothetical protein